MGEDDKVTRVLDLYERFQSGERINKQREAQRYQVNERTIQRDIDSIRRFLANQVVERGVVGDIVYDRMEKGYYLTYECEQDLSGSEVLALCKILLDSRAFPKGKMEHMINRLIEDCASNQNRDMVRRLVANELYHYIELKHGKDVTDTLWQIGQAIQEQRYIEVDYMRTVDKKVVRRKIKPVAIMFSDFYFYLTAFIEDEKVRILRWRMTHFPRSTVLTALRNCRCLTRSLKCCTGTVFRRGNFVNVSSLCMAGSFKGSGFGISGIR